MNKTKENIDKNSLKKSEVIVEKENGADKKSNSDIRVRIRIGNFILQS